MYVTRKKQKFLFIIAVIFLDIFVCMYVIITQSIKYELITHTNLEMRAKMIECLIKIARRTTGAKGYNFLAGFLRVFKMILKHLLKVFC